MKLRILDLAEADLLSGASNAEVSST